jgi:hypothetical protein
MKRLPTFVMLGLSFFAAAAEGQSNPSLIDPFQDDSEAQAVPGQSQGVNAFSDAVADLFGPSGGAAITPNAAPDTRWQDLNAIDPGGKIGGAYDDSYNQRINDVINAPLPKKKPFTDPLERLKKDPGQGTLFGPPGKRAAPPRRY